MEGCKDVVKYRDILMDEKCGVSASSTLWCLPRKEQVPTWSLRQVWKARDSVVCNNTMWEQPQCPAVGE